MKNSQPNRANESGKFDVWGIANPLLIADKRKFGKHSLDDLPFRAIIVDYSDLYRTQDRIQREIVEFGHDCLLFSSNFVGASKIDRGPLLRALRVGYSSFGGIDGGYVEEQTAQCFQDLVSPGGIADELVNIRSVDEASYRCDENHGTFSLVVDEEQIGGCKFGLPRILSLLGELDCPATFFFTNLVEEAYPGTTKAVSGLGHEVALHGLYHEFLSGRQRSAQGEMIGIMKRRLGVEANGANFISRMDADTLTALSGNGLEYAVYPSICNYVIGRFSTSDSLPMNVEVDSSVISMMPVQVETYGRPIQAVRGAILRALRDGYDQGFPHITILIHSFRDGSLRRVGEIRHLLNYLQERLGLSPARLQTVSRWVKAQGMGGHGLPVSKIEDRFFSADRRKLLLADSLIHGKKGEGVAIIDPRNLIPRNLTDVALGPLMNLTNLRWLKANRTHLIDD